MENKPEERTESDEREYVFRFRVPRLRCSLLNEESRRHVRAAQKEMLLAVRSMVDAAIARTEAGPNAEGKGPTKIEVE